MIPTPKDPDRTEVDTRSRILAAAERLFRDIGYQKTTVADIARSLSMSSGNVYRFFASKAEINETVARSVLAEVETAARAIAQDTGRASERLRRLIETVAQMNSERSVADVRLHELVSAAQTEYGSVVQEHIRTMDELLAKIIAEGAAAGEFGVADATMAARLVHMACLRFWHPRLVVEFRDASAASLDHMIEFCLAALRP